MFDSTKEFILKEQYKNPYILKRKARSFVFKFFRFLFLLGLGYLFLLPVIYMIVTTFQHPDTTTDPTIIFVPKQLSLYGLVTSWEYMNYSESGLLTLIFTVFGTLASIFSCSMVGYGFARFNFPLKGLVFSFVLLTIIVPPQTIIMSSYLNYWFFDFGGILSLFGIEINILNTAWVFVLPALFGAGIKNGLFIFIFRQFFLGQPKDLEEAARIDGCGPFKTFIRIMVSLAVPAFVTVLLFSIVWHWNDFHSASIYFTNDLKPVSCMLRNIGFAMMFGGASKDKTHFETRMIFMGSTFLAIAPPLLMYVFAQRFFTESIERSGLVG